MEDIQFRIGEIAGAVTINVIFAGACSLISALILQLITRWVCGYKPTYWQSYKICFLIFFISSLLAFFIKLLLLVPQHFYGLLKLISYTLFQFLLFPKFFNIFTKETNLEQIGYGKASLLGFVYITINTIYLAVGGPLLIKFVYGLLK